MKMLSFSFTVSEYKENKPYAHLISLDLYASQPIYGGNVTTFPLGFRVQGFKLCTIFTFSPLVSLLVSPHCPHREFYQSLLPAWHVGMAGLFSRS